MTRKRERVFMGTLAVLFIMSATVPVIAVVYDKLQQSQNDKKGQAMQLQGTQLSGFKPVASIPKLEVIDTKPGTGATVQPGATVTVDYTGAVAATGIIFQSSKDSGQAVTFPLNQVIAGWSQGIPGMKVGGTRRLLIPASLAYGANPPSGSNIPANADLVFDVTLHAIAK